MGRGHYLIGYFAESRLALHTVFVYYNTFSGGATKLVALEHVEQTLVADSKPRRGWF